MRKNWKRHSTRSLQKTPECEGPLLCVLFKENFKVEQRIFSGCGDTMVLAAFSLLNDWIFQQQTLGNLFPWFPSLLHLLIMLGSPLTWFCTLDRQSPEFSFMSSPKPSICPRHVSWFESSAAWITAFSSLQASYWGQTSNEPQRKSQSWIRLIKVEHCGPKSEAEIASVYCINLKTRVATNLSDNKLCFLW